tara:strand:- start:1697 stop:3121 length:1425 start_codon:yes stop_codon:yes gene_type:complete
MTEKKKNIIVCLCDQLRASEVGCYGNEVIQTPNMDALAKQGTRFQHGISNDPLCMPARSIVVSGQYARTCSGQLNNTSILFDAKRGVAGGWMMPPYPEMGRPHLPDQTLPECLQSDGYHTAAIGKWHIHSWPNDVGFDEYVIPRTQHCHVGQHYTRNGGPEFVPPGFSVDFELDEIESFLDRQESEPFFLFYNISPPHTPLFDIPEEYRTMYDPADMPIRDNCFIDGVMADSENVFKTYLYDNKQYFYKLPHTKKDLPDGFDLRHLYTQYYGATSWVDSALGRLMKMLHDNGMEDDTIVLFTADHGDNLGSHHKWNKSLMYQESTSVPYILHVPGVTEGTVVETQMVSHVDIMPTLLDLVGIDTPPHVQGRSVAPVIRGDEDVLPNNHVFIESEIQAVGIRTPQYTLAKRFDRTTGETSRENMRLYDVQADPFEMTNLAASDPGHCAIAELEGMLDDWHEHTPWMDIDQHVETN